MKIEQKGITIRELVNKYEDNEDDGVFGYGGKLDIRPPYQRAFIYKEKERNAVIDTLIKGYPLNVMYWVVRENGTFEVLDGQQRTMSICQYLNEDFSVNDINFDLMSDEKKKEILDYKLMVYFCSGTKEEKLEWFKTINIAGKELADQELLNAIYHGEWVTDAKRYFSKMNYGAYSKGQLYLDGSFNRQKYLETAIKWISNDNVKGHMSDMTKKGAIKNAKNLYQYFVSVIEWVEEVFPKYRPQMKGVQWGYFYNELKDKTFNSAKLEKEVSELMSYHTVGNKRGIYEYLLKRDYEENAEKHLNVRAFSVNQKTEAYEKQKGICARCKKYFAISKMQADHIKPWSKGGETSSANCQVLCEGCNLKKSNK